jgi:hypothetical protein
MRLRYILIFLILLGGTIGTLEYSGIVNFLSAQKLNPHFFEIENKNFIKWARSFNEKDSQEKYSGTLDTSFFKGPLTLTKITRDNEKLYGDFDTRYQGYDISGKFEIDTSNNSDTALRLDILSGSIKTIYGSANRMSGAIAFLTGEKSYLAEGTLNTGTLNYGGISFQGNQIRITGPISNASGALTAEIVGHTGSVLESSGLFDQGQLMQMKGVFSIQSPYYLIQTMHVIATGSDKKDFPEWKDVPPITFIFEETPKSTPENRRYAMRVENMEEQFRGLISLNPELNVFRLVSETKDLSGYPLEYNQKLENGEKVSKVYADLILNGRNNDDRYGYAD